MDRALSRPRPVQRGVVGDRRAGRVGGAGVVVGVPRHGHELGHVARLHQILANAVQRHIAFRQHWNVRVHVVIVEVLRRDTERPDLFLTPILNIDFRLAHGEGQVDAGAEAPAQAVDQRRLVQQIARRQRLDRRRAALAVVPLGQEVILRQRRRQEGLTPNRRALPASVERRASPAATGSGCGYRPAPTGSFRRDWFRRRCGRPRGAPAWRPWAGWKSIPEAPCPGRCGRHRPRS